MFKWKSCARELKNSLGFTEANPSSPLPLSFVTFSTIFLVLRSCLFSFLDLIDNLYNNAILRIILIRVSLCEDSKVL
jgi:hypothetical protein